MHTKNETGFGFDDIGCSERCPSSSGHGRGSVFSSISTCCYSLSLCAGTFQQKNDLSTWVVSVIQDNVADLDQSLSDVLSRNEGPLGSFLTGHGRKYPYTCALWGTEWQQLARHKASYDPTRMLYMIHEDQFHEYWMRVFVNGAGVCCVDFMKRDEFILEQGL